MRFFALLDLQYLTVSLCLGLVALILVYLSWASYTTRKEAPGDGRDAPEVSPGPSLPPHGPGNPVPAFVIFIYLGMLFSAVGYWLYAALSGIPVGY